MPRYFVPAAAIADGIATIDGHTAHHIATSRRARRGDEIEVVDDTGTAHTLRVIQASDRGIEASVVSSGPAGGEPSLDIAIVQALIKDGMDEAVDFMTACGVNRIVPTVTEHVVVRIDGDKAARKCRRWREIARQSAQVAYRARVPDVSEIMTLDQALSAVADSRILACAMTEGSVSLPSLALQAHDRVTLVVGPEGGFSPADITRLRQSKAEFVHLGPRVLRSRLAGGCAATVCMSVAGQLSPAPEAMAT